MGDYGCFDDLTTYLVESITPPNDGPPHRNNHPQTSRLCGWPPMSSRVANRYPEVDLSHSPEEIVGVFIIPWLHRAHHRRVWICLDWLGGSICYNLFFGQKTCYFHLFPIQRFAYFVVKVHHAWPHVDPKKGGPIGMMPRKNRSEKTHVEDS